MSDRAPLTPAGCDLHGLAYMPLDVGRLLESDLFALSTGEEFKAALALWGRSWTQVPAASIPQDERLLARLASVSLAEWRRIAPAALRGWVACNDGRLYHPVVAEKALQAWIARIEHTRKGAFGAAKRYGNAFDPQPFERSASEAVAYLQRLSVSLGAKAAASLQRHEKLAPASGEDSPGYSPGHPKTSRSSSGRDILPVGGESAPAEPNKESWDRAAALLTKAGRMKAAAARSFLGRLLATHKLEARDLLASIVSAEGAGSADPQGYLTRAAQAVATRRHGSTGPATTNPEAWTVEDWTAAVEAYRGGKPWAPDRMGPEPGKPGCRVPSHLLVQPAPSGAAA